MKYTSFLRALKLLEKQKNIFESNISVINKTRAKQKYRKIVKLIEEDMVDRNKNFSRWLHKNDCIVKNPINDNVATIHIGNDIEAIYYFLKIMKKRNLREVVDDALFDYCCYLITRSTYERNL